MTPSENICLDTGNGKVLEDLDANSSCEKLDGIDHSKTVGPGDSGEAITGSNKEQSCPREEKGWLGRLARVCASHLSPDHPCVQHLKEHGFDLGAAEDFDRFTTNPSILGGRR